MTASTLLASDSSARAAGAKATARANASATRRPDRTFMGVVAPSCGTAHSPLPWGRGVGGDCTRPSAVRLVRLLVAKRDETRPGHDVEPAVGRHRRADQRRSPETFQGVRRSEERRVGKEGRCGWWPVDNEERSY